jgi:hypothetical protein
MATKPRDYDRAYKGVQKYYVHQVLLTKDLFECQADEWESIGNPRILSLYHLLVSIYITDHAIHLLATNNFLGESYMLARSLLEKLINYMYLLVCDEKEYEKYLAYTKQKGYRILDRSLTVGEQKVALRRTGSVNLDDYPELKDAVNEFTSSKGKAVKSKMWTSVSLADRLATIRDQAAIKIEGLMFSILGVYDDASEALHGSLYGVTFNYGFFERIPSTPQELSETYRNRLLLLLFALGTSIGTLFKVIPGMYSSEKVKDFARQSISNLRLVPKLED